MLADFGEVGARSRRSQFHMAIDWLDLFVIIKKLATILTRFVSTRTLLE